MYERLRLGLVDPPVSFTGAILVDGGTPAPVRPSRAELPAGGVDVGAPVAPDRGGERRRRASRSANARMCGAVGGPAAEARGGVERDEVHVGAARAERCEQPAERLGLSSGASFTPAMHAYSNVTRRPVATRRLGAASMHLGERVAAVERDQRVAQRVVGRVQRDRERDRAASSSARRRMPGTTPTVETVMRRAEMPKSSCRRVTARPRRVVVGERLAHAHEHDVASPVAAMRARRAATCSTISPASRWRSKPAWPVAQNVQPIAQPACDDTQTVARSG